jgi:hypothetical protein
MPLYDFENAKTKEVREFCVPVGTAHMRRTDGDWVRTATPARPGIVVGARPEPGQREEVLRGYAEAENRLGSRMRTRLPASEIKRIWAKD